MKGFWILEGALKLGTRVTMLKFAKIVLLKFEGEVFVNYQLVRKCMQDRVVKIVMDVMLKSLGGPPSVKVLRLFLWKLVWGARPCMKA